MKEAQFPYLVKCTFKSYIIWYLYCTPERLKLKRQIILNTGENVEQQENLHTVGNKNWYNHSENLFGIFY